jgi:two-component system sensor histidine kinase AlgZ
LFNELPASLQKRVRYDPLAQSTDPDGLTVTGKLEFSGLLNDKDIGDPDLTAAPPAVYILEPNIMTEKEKETLQGLDKDENTAWDIAVQELFVRTRNPDQLKTELDSETQVVRDDYLVGLQPQAIRDPVTEEPELEPIEPGSDVMVIKRDPLTPAPLRAFGPGLALVPNAGFLDPQGTLPDPENPEDRIPYPEVSWVSVVENNDPGLGGSPITVHVIKVDRRERYRGSIKTVLSDNVFDENIILRHTGDFGAHADDLVFEWWYRPDDGSLNVPPPDLVPANEPNPWELFPDPKGERGRGRFQTKLKGNPNAPEALLADTFWFVRYRHENDQSEGTDWDVPQPNGTQGVDFTWAGAGNSDPFNDFNSARLPDFRAQLAQGWIKRVPVVPRMVLLYLVLQLVTAGATLAAHTLVGGGEFGWQPGGDLGMAMLRNVGISAIITGVMLRYFYVRHQHALREQAEERMRIEALQARIRPHFLFNSLNTIASLIHRRPDEAEEAVLDLAELFRSTFGKKSRITLAEELDIVRRYLAMEQLRLGGRLQVLWDIPPALDDVELPALVVQPLAENAIYHGIEPLAEGGSVRISARREVDTVHIHVSNPRPGGTRPAHARGNRVAMDNIRQRLSLAYGQAAALKVEETAAEYCVTLILPVSGQTG